MRRTFLVALIASFGTVATLRAAEPVAPEVKAVAAAPEVADPELKEALPAMRAGTDEPLGGFKEAKRKGRSAVSLGQSLQTTTMPVLGWHYWTGDSTALVTALGFSYSDDRHNASTALVEELGFRWVGAELGPYGFFFGEARANARQGRSSAEAQSQQTGYVQYQSDASSDETYGGDLRLGAELFWPGSQRVSVEASGGLGASWSRRESETKSVSSDGVSGTNSDVKAVNERSDVGTRFSNLTLALNLYY